VEKLWQESFQAIQPLPRWMRGSDRTLRRNGHGGTKFWIALDAITVPTAFLLAALLEIHTYPLIGFKGIWRGTLVHDRSMGILLALLSEFAFVLVLTSRQLHLYKPKRLTSLLHEQRLSVQACCVAGLILTGTLYLIDAADIPRSLILTTLGLVAILLSLRRAIYRLIFYRQFQRGVGTRNVLIVGVGPQAQALRHHLDSIRHLGYTFKGFVDPPGAGSGALCASENVVGNFDTLFQNARRHFVDEIFFTAHCEPEVIQNALEQARIQGVDLRMLLQMFDGVAWNNPIEYVGQFPVIPLHCGHVPEIALLLKRCMDVAIASLALTILSPLLLVIAIAVKLDSKGPALYLSDRIGKKGRVFKCFKFRTMVSDAEKRRADVMHLNERDGVLFKIERDPRITRLGRVLRKYSLDELPQLLNVLRGEMSVVGPRPPIASEVREYKLSHLRRLDVTPGITGLWQVHARTDPSFDNYVSLDVTYIDNWSIWLDIKIICRTVGVIIAGTGS